VCVRVCVCVCVWVCVGVRPSEVGRDRMYTFGQYKSDIYLKVSQPPHPTSPPTRAASHPSPMPRRRVITLTSLLPPWLLGPTPQIMYGKDKLCGPVGIPIKIVSNHSVGGG
jgi:hypothetical protein